MTGIEGLKNGCIRSTNVLCMVHMEEVLLVVIEDRSTCYEEMCVVQDSIACLGKGLRR